MPKFQLDVIAIVCVIPFLLENVERIPNHNLLLTGEIYLQELLTTESEARFRSVARMDKPTFFRLLRFLSQHTDFDNFRTICGGEKLLFFIEMLVGHSVRQVAERWLQSRK